MFHIGLFFSAALLGVGLATDAFSVSLANGLQAPRMSRRHALFIASLFAAFQGLMPLLGYFLVRTATRRFLFLQRYIPFLALFLLLFIGGKMILDGLLSQDLTPLGGGGLLTLLAQGLATSIDALSAGFTIAAHPPSVALLFAAIIALVTLPLCLFGVLIGRKFGMGLAGGAAVVGGILLILIGIEVFFGVL